MQDIYNGQAGFTNATGVDDAIKFVSQKFKENLKPNNASRDDKEEESNEPDYDEDKDQLEEDQEDEAGEMTINQAF